MLRMAGFVAELGSHLQAPLVHAGVQPHWYAAYTCPRHEKRVAGQFENRSIDHFLPLYEQVHRWKDRRARVSVPLFPGYLFVHVPLQDRLEILETPGVVRLVSFNGQPAPLPDCDIEALRAGLLQGWRAAPHPYLTVGRRVRVTNGPFQGIEGILKRKKDNFRLVLSIDLIMRSVLLDIDGAEVEPLS